MGGGFDVIRESSLCGRFVSSLETSVFGYLDAARGTNLWRTKINILVFVCLSMIFSGNTVFSVPSKDNGNFFLPLLQSENSSHNFFDQTDRVIKFCRATQTERLTRQIVS